MFHFSVSDEVLGSFRLGSFLKPHQKPPHDPPPQIQVSLFHGAPASCLGHSILLFIRSLFIWTTRLFWPNLKLLLGGFEKRRGVGATPPPLTPPSSPTSGCCRVVCTLVHMLPVLRLSLGAGVKGSSSRGSGRIESGARNVTFA